MLNYIGDLFRSLALPFLVCGRFYLGICWGINNLVVPLICSYFVLLGLDRRCGGDSNEVPMVE